MGRARKPDSREVDELWKSVKSLGWSRRQFLALLSSGGIAAVLNACKSHSPSVPARNKADEACISSGAEKQEEPASSQSATSEKKTSGSEGEHLEVYDYIIVGSGAGGGPLAANLARAGQKVLLLEAGGNDEPLDYSMPVRHGYATENEALSWRYYVKHYSDGHPRQGLEPKTVPTTDGRRRVFYPRAGTLGGCTAHYAMIIVYPHNSDWDYIAEVTGDESWRPDKMRKYFECVERYRYVDPQAREESDELLLSWRTWLKRRLADFDSYIFEADARVFWNILADSVHWAESIVGRMAESAWWKNAQHGFAGWLPVNQAPLSLLLRDKQLINIVRSCVDTALTYGLEPITWRFDPNHWIVAVERREGLLRTPMATDGKKRRGVREYLVETQKHYAEYLTIETHALATKILFQDCDPLAADGVEYRRGAHLYAADPKSAVKETEERDGLIFVRHPASRLEEKCEPQEVLCKAKAKKEVILAAGAFNTPQLLMLSGIGPEEELRKHNICVRKSLPGVGGNLQDRYEVGVITELENNFTVLEDATFSDSEADLAFLDWKRGEGLYTTNGAVLGIIKRSKPERLDPDLFIFGAPGHFNGYYPHWSQDAYAYKNRFSWVILKAHTNNNAGTVRLTSCRPEDTPDINFRYFDEGNDDGEDLTSVLEGIKFVRQINKRVENRVLIRREIIPGDSIRDDQQLREFIKNNAWGHHACGTCKMGPPDDPLAVVDGQFRVYGVKNLRIVDASIFPKIPGFFIVSAIYMISEKASAVLLGDARPAASCGNHLEAPGRVACER